MRTRDTHHVTAAIRIERSGPAVRAALARTSAAEPAQLAAEFGRAVDLARAQFDLAPAEAVLNRWLAVAVARANPLSEQEEAQLSLAREGAFDGMRERDEAGGWKQL